MSLLHGFRRGDPNTAAYSPHNAGRRSAQLPAATAIFEDYLAMAWKILKRLESEFYADRNSFKPR
jgi:hypothetical protein